MRKARCLAGHLFRGLGLLIVVFSLSQPIYATEESKPTFMRVPTQFIAALGDPVATSGGGAQSWGLWRRDPGPRGAWLNNYEKLEAASGIAPAKWEFDNTEWWLEENGLIMEKPEFPLPHGKYIVTGDRRWELDDNAKPYDVSTYRVVQQDTHQ